LHAFAQTYHQTILVIVMYHVTQYTAVSVTWLLCVAEVLLKADDRQFNGSVVLPSQAPVSVHTPASAKRTRPTTTQARK